jgi:hypothetical protein
LRELNDKLFHGRIGHQELSALNLDQQLLETFGNGQQDPTLAKLKHPAKCTKGTDSLKDVWIRSHDGLGPFHKLGKVQHTSILSVTGSEYKKTSEDPESHDEKLSAETESFWDRAYLVIRRAKKSEEASLSLPARSKNDFAVSII